MELIPYEKSWMKSFSIMTLSNIKIIDQKDVTQGNTFFVVLLIVNIFCLIYLFYFLCGLLATMIGEDGTNV
jgi:hypothetical protein